MEQKLLDLLSDVLGVPTESLNIESSSQTVESWDSLKHMNIIFAVEDEFGILIPDEKLSETTSVKLLLDVIQEG
ncbi:acyl carrier protein [Marinomonas sp. 2405UD68-3]|uniref:acyl carrier protein n=1 Tax=Marinomonas sp. 2405UD68-3 TaxID=3391835 RepID=UPI0039C8DD1E